MTFDEYMITLQSQPHGGSGRGISYWSKAATCGRKAVIDELEKQEAGPQASGDDSEDTNALEVGTHYHRLHELAIRGQQPQEVWDMRDAAMSPSLLEAIRLYRGYVNMWGSVGSRFGGEAIGTEVQIPATAEGAAKIKADYGDDLTGRIDAIVRIDDVQACAANTGLVLEPGLYLVDFKSLKSHSAQHEWTYQFSLQASTYLEIYNMEHPEAPAKGMIFDIIFKHANLRKVADKKGGASHAAYVQYPNGEDKKVIQSLVQLGKRNIENGGMANPAACLSGFSPCKHFATGKCGRF